MIMKLTLVAAVLLASAVPALAAPTIADGTYACMLDGAALGYVKLAGGTYQGLAAANDGPFGNPQNFITMDPDRIEWLGDLGDLDAQGYRADHTVIREGGFDLTLLKPDQSDFVTATCVLS
jgi:hypothetical protein